VIRDEKFVLKIFELEEVLDTRLDVDHLRHDAVVGDFIFLSLVLVHPSRVDQERVLVDTSRIVDDSCPGYHHLV
jgi:hypothetical protein